jgi:hypothetical protein
MAPLHLFPYNKQVLVICTHFHLGYFGFLATFCWWQSWRNTYLETQIPIDNQIVSRIEFYSFNLLGVLAMDCLLEFVVNCSESLHQTYKSLSHRFCILTNGSLLPNIQLVLGIPHRWISFLFSWQQGTSLNLEELDKPCLLSFSKWNKAIESGEVV